MSGETDLKLMLDSMTVGRRPGSYCFVTNRDDLVVEAEAVVRETEGTTVVVRTDTARRLGLDPGFEAAWLTLEVYSALEAVGLTAAVSRVLADHSIPCNMLAGYHHDHLLVPVDRAEEAIDAIEGLASSV